MLDPDLLARLLCPVCGSSVRQAGAGLRCESCETTFSVVDGIPIMLSPDARAREDIRISAGKWQRHWQGLDWGRAREDYDRQNLPSIHRHLRPATAGEWFLEIGSGPSFLTFDLAGRGTPAVALDLDLDVLRDARRQFARHGRAAHFICASIDRLPFKPRVFGVSAGIGVLEHCRAIEQSVAEVARVTAPGGITFQTVPLLSALTLITASLRYGTVPHAPLLAPLVRFVHITLLGTRRMAYGYEESFTLGFLRRLFARAGFQRVDAGFYDYGQTVFKTVPVLRAIFHVLLRLKVLGMRPFADVAYVRAVM